MTFLVAGDLGKFRVSWYVQMDESTKMSLLDPSGDGLALTI